MIHRTELEERRGSSTVRPGQRSGRRPPDTYHAGRTRRVLGIIAAIAMIGACSGGHGAAVRPTRAVVPSPPLSSPGQPNNANRILLWLGCQQVAEMDDATLDQWKARGIGGFVCVSQALFAFGGDNHFIADVDHIPPDPEYAMERALQSSKIGARTAARGLDLYLGFYLLNKNNTQTPLVEWFDDNGWSSELEPAVRDIAGAAKNLGFKGMAFDQELYAQTNGVKTATWAANYPGNKHSQADTRAKVRARGEQLMDALIDGFPGLDLLAYGTQFPGTWAARVQKEANHVDNAFASSVQLEFWDGVSSAHGYRSIRLLNEAFYKDPGVDNTSWDGALQQEYNQLFSLLSQRFTNWAYAAPRFDESPFIWISKGTSDFQRARSPAAVADQLDAFSRWGMGGVFADYVFGDLDSFDYGPYLPALKEASTPNVVTDQPPTIRVTAPSTESVFHVGDGRVTLSGSSHDPYAIWYVLWKDDRGGDGAARLTWVPGPGDDRNGHPNWDMQWTADIPLQDGANVITMTAVGIKGLPSTTVVTITH